MTRAQARRIVLARRPEGPPRADDFAIETVDLPSLNDGDLLLESRWLSVDPMIAILVAKAPLGGAVPPLSLGTVIPGAAVSRVLESRAATFATGDLVEGRTGWQDRTVVPAAAVRKLPPGSGVEALGILGLPGLAAWAGLSLVPDLAAKTVLISGASGSVGAIAGQLARLRGAHVIGLAGGPDKVRHLVDMLGFDAAIDYRAEDVGKRIGAMSRKIDVYFDNVGGDLVRQIVPHFASGATVLVCGLMGEYAVADDARPDFTASALLTAVMAKSLRIVGFNNRAFADAMDRFEREMTSLINSGSLIETYSIRPGLEGAIGHVAEMFGRRPIGKQVAALEP